jgi:hypothetical protein
MYNKGFVVSVKNDKGEILRESKNQEVFVPYHTNYSLRLKNNNNKKAVASIFIDGTDVLGEHQMIIEANRSIDVERFCLDGDLSRGRKFEFVPLSDSRVQDPTEEENGLIKVRFWLEKTVPTIINIPYYPSYPYQPYYRNLWDDSVGPHLDRGPIITCSSNFMTGSAGSVNVAESNYSSIIRNNENIGATVEGTSSDQCFNLGHTNELENVYTEIILRLRAAQKSVTVQETKNKFCSNCRAKNRKKANFCTNCGTKF